MACFVFAHLFVEHERLLDQVRASMDAARPGVARIVNAFGLSVKFVDIAKASRGISGNVVYQGYTTKGRHSEVQRVLVVFPRTTTCTILRSRIKTTSADHFHHDA